MIPVAPEVIALLKEATRIKPTVMTHLREAANQDDLDRVIDEAREVVEEEADHGFM